MKGFGTEIKGPNENGGKHKPFRWKLSCEGRECGLEVNIDNKS
jgi:hypothetical protein